MTTELSEIHDMIAAVTAQIDQSQALIDEGRLIYSNSTFVQHELDKNQAGVDYLRSQVEMLKIKAKDAV